MIHTGQINNYFNSILEQDPSIDKGKAIAQAIEVYCALEYQLSDTEKIDEEIKLKELLT
jgi:hypothetical protein